MLPHLMKHHLIVALNIQSKKIIEKQFSVKKKYPFKRNPKSRFPNSIKFTLK